MKTSTLSPVVTLTVGRQSNRTIEVRELAWRDYLRAVKELTGTAMQVFSGARSGALTVDKDAVVKAIGDQEELVAWLIGRSTDLTQEEVADLTAKDAIAIVQAMVDLNLSEEVLGPGKTLAGRMGQVFGLRIGSPKSPTTSSPTGTPSATPSASPSGS